jgi:predicted ribonuclease YlaK
MGKSMKHIVQIVALFAGLLTSNTLLACSCLETTTEEKYKNASMVFIGHIVQAKEITNGPKTHEFKLNRYIEATYDVVEVFKGAPNNRGVLADDVVRDGSCAVGVLPGVNYIIFLDKSNTVSLCDGTHIYRSVRDGVLIHRLRALKGR